MGHNLHKYYNKATKEKLAAQAFPFTFFRRVFTLNEKGAAKELLPFFHSPVPKKMASMHTRPQKSEAQNPSTAHNLFRTREHLHNSCDIRGAFLVNFRPCTRGNVCGVVGKIRKIFLYLIRLFRA